MATIFELKNCSAGYGSISVLHGVSITIEESEIVSIIGANGAGKTTTLLCSSRIVPLRSGDIQFQGQSVINRKACDLVSLGIAHVPEGRKIFSRLTVDENLDLGAYTVDDKNEVRSRREVAYDLFPILKERSQQPGGTLSGGEQQMLAIARALMSAPKLLLLDEPSMGVAPIFVEKIFDTIQSLNKNGMTILLVEQNAHAALQIAHRGYVIETGQIILTDTGTNLLKNPKVLEAYLGA